MRTHLVARSFAVLALALVGGLGPLLMPSRAQSADLAIPLIRAASGSTPADIQAAVDQFRADLGALNPNVVGSFGSGRREINWDGVPDQFASPNAFPPDFFNRNSPRGAVFSTPGSGFQVSADDDNPTDTPVRFGNIDPSYPNTFAVFSPQRLFTPIGSTVTDVHFFVPGTDTPATVSGFGAVFTDVDTLSTWIEYFDAADRSLGRFPVPPSPSGGLSFLGVSFLDLGIGEAARIGRVRITSGARPLGAGVHDSIVQDLVVMDDFIYGEPQAIPDDAP